MASNETILAWKAELLGAESVKDGLRKINEEVKKGSLTQTEANRVIQTATKDTRNYRAEQNLLNRSFMSTHPNIALLSRTMSTFGNIARTGLNIANSLNIMWIRQNQTAIALSEANYEVAKATRDLNLARQKGNPLEIAEAEERLNMALEKQATLKTGDFWTKLTDVATIGLTITTAVSTIFTNLTKSTLVTNALTNAGSRLGAMFGGAFQAGAVAAIFLLAAFGIEEAYKQAFNIKDVDAWREANVKALTEVFTISIPMALGTAAQFLTQFFLTDLPLWASSGLDFLKKAFINTWNGIISVTNVGVNAVISGVNNIINGAISAINAFISAINNILKKAKLGTISLIPKFQGIPPINIPMIAAAKGFNGMVNSPTMFLAGEAGPEQVSISPNSRGGGGGINVTVNVQGSILTERELFRRVDENLKNELRKRNFRILQ